MNKTIEKAKIRDMTNDEIIDALMDMLYGAKAFNRFEKEERDTLLNCILAVEGQSKVEKLYQQQVKNMKEKRFQTHFNVGRLDALKDATGRSLTYKDAVKEHYERLGGYYNEGVSENDAGRSDQVVAE